MGCFLSLFCGVRGSERRPDSRLENESVEIHNEATNITDDEILIYSPQSSSFRPSDHLKGNRKLIYTDNFDFD